MDPQFGESTAESPFSVCGTVRECFPTSSLAGGQNRPSSFLQNENSQEQASRRDAEAPDSVESKDNAVLRDQLRLPISVQGTHL